MTIDCYETTGRAGTAKGLLRRLIEGRVARAAERRSMAHLARLDDRLLRDVGLTRAEVATMVERRDGS